MNLLIAYVVTVLIGQTGVVAVALFVDSMYTPFISLTVFFVLFFLMFWLAWRVAVRLTEPRQPA